MSEELEMQNEEAIEQEAMADGEGNEQAAPAEVEQAATEPSTDDDDDVIVSFGDEEPPAVEQEKAPEWVRDLRRQNRELKRQLKEQEAQRTASQSPAPGIPTLGPKPTLDNPTGNPDDAYDAEKFETALEAWHNQRNQIEAAKAKMAQAEKEQHAAWNAKLAAYAEAKSKLKVHDYDDAEAVVTETLSETQQAIILKGAKNPALLVLALGRNQAKAKHLAGIADPIEFAFAVADLEKDMKTTTRKSPPPPEKTVTAPTGGAVASDATLAKLEEEAARTGDRSKIAKYYKEKGLKR